MLIANRGEIALRIARTCKELGIRTVAVYSTEDRDSAVVSYADEAVRIGPASAKHSYLNIPAIVEAALRTGVRAVHPGYGFLSEDPDFARVCRDAGLTFVGPAAEVIARLGDKIAARALMAENAIPMLPGSRSPVDSVEDACEIADSIGFPLVVKAAAGGGGRGMGVVGDRADLAAVFSRTQSRAQELFGDARVFVERYLPEGRHVEVQVLVDGFGNALHLGERDCSTQRRHQKLIEETPAPGIPEQVRAGMQEAAVLGATAAGYRGAATFEFLLAPDGTFAFLEVNCRLQVEHPVTEMATGVDLVREQLLIADGQPLSLHQEDLAARGCSVECRINAEDPERGFVPTPGTLAEFDVPGGPFVRVDTHGYPGYRVPSSYDPLLAKLVVWGCSREDALRRMDRCLADFRISGPGVRTNSAFLREVIGHPAFRAGRYSTAVVDDVFRARENGAALASRPPADPITAERKGSVP
ncbi:acetyl-CoA carboxylase biotin carboxylase subunit [Streptomonospora wellingtoniae]|uniref:biotin carboxylase n=1 Tax=Streptomonospora wellingtoniae TaxID=3075544 RepID=A0ABU2KXF5_9ACTN|nr:biotin carboxylase N-terminal domain-containing protein [Streptomonospora sp. DSM 45055]MDT0303933.1 biotin carboxylase N-terminal domain-containing protein [Streptomonospora sp. DSM 45055]